MNRYEAIQKSYGVGHPLQKQTQHKAGSELGAREKVTIEGIE